MTPDRTTDCSKRTFDGMVRLMSHMASAFANVGTSSAPCLGCHDHWFMHTRLTGG